MARCVGARWLKHVHFAQRQLLRHHVNEGYSDRWNGEANPMTEHQESSLDYLRNAIRRCIQEGLTLAQIAAAVVIMLKEKGQKR